MWEAQPSTPKKMPTSSPSKAALLLRLKRRNKPSKPEQRDGPYNFRDPKNMKYADFNHQRNKAWFLVSRAVPQGLEEIIKLADGDGAVDCMKEIKQKAKNLLRDVMRFVEEEVDLGKRSPPVLEVNEESIKTTVLSIETAAKARMEPAVSLLENHINPPGKNKPGVHFKGLNL